MVSESTVEDDARPRPVERSPWVAVGVVLVGTYAAVLNVTVIGVALPAIADELGSAGISVDWVVTSFLVGVVLALISTGWLADRLGRRTVYLASLTLFGIGALTCALAPTMEIIVGGRFVQGLGGGALMPVGMAIVYDLFPPDRRGSALGFWGVAVMAAPAAGPPLGGWIVDAASWRWIFGVFVIVAGCAVALSARWLPDVGHREKRRLDVGGLALAAIGVCLVVIGFRQIAEWGPTAPASLAVALAAVVTLTALVRRCLRVPEPIIDFRMFAGRTYAVAMLVIGMLSVTQASRLTFLPVELQIVRDLEPRHVGLLLAPAAAGTALMMPISGWIADRVGARVPVVVGLSFLAFSMWNLAHLTPDGSEAFIVSILVLQGLGMGLVSIPTTVTAMNSLPQRYVAQASAVNNLTRQLGQAVGVSLLGAVLVLDLGAVAPVAPDIDQAQAAYNRVFFIAFWFLIGAIAAALLLPNRTTTKQHHADRIAEQQVATD